jgi:hypothetical protein
MLAIPWGTVLDGNMIVFRPGPEPTAEPARDAHQVSVIQVFIGTVQSSPPAAHASTVDAHREIRIQDDAIHTVIAAFKQIAVQGAQFVRHDFGA